MLINGQEIDIDLEQTAIANGKIAHTESQPDYSPLVSLSKLGCTEQRFLDEEQRTYDAWQNQIASIGLNNSIQQFTEYTFQRVSYQMCAAYATDAIIHKAIEVIVEECFSHGANFRLVSKDNNEEIDIIKFNDLFVSEGYWDIARTAFKNSLVFGGALIYIDTTDSKLDKQLYLDTESEGKFLSFKVLEPWQFAPSIVNTARPLRDDYMKPSAWYVMGEGSIHSSRFIKAVAFPISDLYKPLYNYLGLPLTFFMKDYVSVADTVRQSLGDLFLRFSTITIKTPNHKITNQVAYERIKNILTTRNNLGAVVLEKDEEYVVDAMSLSGLSEIVKECYELVTATSYVPTIKLLGIEPSGFNSTGEFSMKNYYDNIAAFQTNVITPYVLKMAESLLALKYKKDVALTIEWNKLGQLDDKEVAELKGQQAQYFTSLKNEDVISSEDILKGLQTGDLSLSWIDADNMPEPDVEEELYGEQQEAESTDN